MGDLCHPGTVRVADEHQARARQIATELAKIARTGMVLPGSLTERHTRCGHPNCACHADPPRRHGPYWQWTRKVAAGGPPLPWTVTTLGSLGTGGTPMVTKYQKFGDGYKAEAVKLYRESNQTIAETARNLGLKESTLANWVKKDKDNEAVAVGEAPLTPAERTRIRELEADVRRLNMENAFLKKASAYFASQNL